MKPASILLTFLFLPFLLLSPPSVEGSNLRTMAGSDPEIIAEQRYHWEVLAPDETETGIITAFAADGNRRCAVGIGDHVLVYEKTACVAAFNFETSGSYRLAFEDGQLIIRANREQEYLQVDLETGRIIALTSTPAGDAADRTDPDLQMEIGDPQTENGYYLTNTLGNRRISLGYDKLVYVENGREEIVYSTVTKLVLECVGVAVALAVATILLHRARRRNSAGGKENNSLE